MGKIAFLIFIVITVSSGAVVHLGLGGFSDIRSAINGAANGDVIEIDAGTYKGINNTAIDVSDRILSFHGTGPVVIDLEGQYNAFTVTGTSATLVFTNITFQNGYSVVGGGALRIARPSNIKLISCQFSNCQSTTDGGALWFYQRNTNSPASNVTLQNVVFLNNSASGSGGAIWAQQSIIEIVGGSFSANSAQENGGTMYLEGSSVISGGVTYLNNSANNGGGAIYAAAQTALSLTNCDVSSNSARNGGGAIRVTGNGYLLLSNCSLDSNRAVGTYGGAVYVDANSIVNGYGCDFSSNSGSLGGAICVSNGAGSFNLTTFILNKASRGGALYYETRSKGNLRDCTITQNAATDGAGAIYLVSQNDVRIYNNTIQNNHANGNGGAFWCADSKINITDSVVKDNTAGGGDPVLYCAYQPYLTYCNVQGNTVSQRCSVVETTTDLSTAQAAGIIVGTIVGAIALVFLCIFLIWKFDLRKRVKEGKIWKSIVGNEEEFGEEPTVDVETKKADPTTTKETEAKDKEGSSSSSSSESE